MKTIRVIAQRTVLEEADVLIRIPEWLNKKHPMYIEYIDDMVYDIATLDGCWELIETQNSTWDVVADPYIEGQP